MQYNKEEIEKKCVEIIERENLAFFGHLAPFIEPAMSTLYLWELEKSERIKNAIYKNRVTKKKRMVTSWEREDAAPVLQLAAFKLMADEDEFNRLATNKQDVKADVKGGVSINIVPQDGCEAIHED